MAKTIKHVVSMTLGGCDRAVSAQAFCEGYTIMLKLVEVIDLIEHYEEDESYDSDLFDSLGECQFASVSNIVTYINKLCPTAPYRIRLLHRAFIDRSSKFYSNGEEMKESTEGMTDTALLQKFSDNAELLSSSYSMSEEECVILKEEVIELIGTIGWFLLKDFQIDKSYNSLNGVVEEEAGEGMAKPVNAFGDNTQTGELVLDECMNEALSYLGDSVETVIENIHSVTERYQPKLTIFEKYPLLEEPFLDVLNSSDYKGLVESIESMLPATLECAEDIQNIIEKAYKEGPEEEVEEDSGETTKLPSGLKEMLSWFVIKYELI